MRRLRTYKTEGIIVKRISVNEADRILTVFTKYHGKITCIAKGVRKPTSRKSGHVELFDRSSLFLAKGKNLDLVTQAEIIERFSHLSQHIKATKAAFHVIELIDRLLPERQEHTDIYLEVLKILRIINKQKLSTRNQIAAFERKILTLLGFGLPKDSSYENLKIHIESIVEKKLSTIETFKNI